MSQQIVTLVLNHQQLELIDRAVAAGEAADRIALVRRAVRESAGEHVAVPSASLKAALKDAGMSDAVAAEVIDRAPAERELIDTIILQPGTGRALEIRAGQVLRIEQIEGAQCVDFNCFNLHDYREFMHTGRTRTLHGINPTTGDFLWSAPPRERAMMYISRDTVSCNDVMFPRCSANLYESVYGYHTHTNCHDIQAEAQREYGLTPDDVHDSFNLFMNTGVREGKPFVDRQNSRPGDHVDLLALMDVLAVPNVCGADVMRTSNYSIKPVKLQIFTAAASELHEVPALRRLKTQRTPADFKLSAIRAERGLTRDPSYQPQFFNTPLTFVELDIALDDGDFELFRRNHRADLYQDDGASLRDVVFSWWEARFI
ncbi:MAG TPA: urea carboxylase-associated family protein [Paraburkholderia sp.]|nr:urea carboxylase-associated family protein [Paraburkholderia sp.]